MSLEPVRFQSAFLQQARSPRPREGVPAAVDGVAPARPQELGWLGRLQGLFRTRSVSALPAQSPLALATTLPGLGAPTAVAVAQAVALSQLSLADETACGQDYRQKCPPAPAQAQERIQALWERLAPHVDPSLEVPLAIERPIGPGMFMGRSLFANGRELEKLSEPVALFFLAHEVGHVEHRDSARKQGQTALSDWTREQAPQFLADLKSEVQAADWAMELAADRRAAEIVARLECDPVPILADLLGEPSGPEHPDGLTRARAVRSTLAEHGVTLPEERWQQLLEASAGPRQDRQRQLDEAQEWLQSMQELR